MRRRADVSWVRRRYRSREEGLQLPGWWWRGGSGPGYGRLLGLTTLLASGLAIVVVRPGSVVWPLLAGVTGFHLLAAWLSFALPWYRWRTGALVVFPVACLASVVALVQAAPELGGVFSGIFVLSFAYVGVYLPRRTGPVLVLPAMAAYLAAYVDSLAEVTEQLLVRLGFVAGAWVLLAELLGRLQRRHAEMVARLRVDSDTDPLTGLANRRGMERFLAEAEPGDTLILFDLDHFKRINDQRGHAAGDVVLQTFGRVLSEQLRTRDRAARSGGEEVVALLRSAEGRLGAEVTERVRQALAESCPGVTFSAGLAVVGSGQSAAEALEAADRAMYRAKAAGRDQVWMAGDPALGLADAAVEHPPLLPADVLASPAVG
jgi:diguanylate cyclase